MTPDDRDSPLPAGPHEEAEDDLSRPSLQAELRDARRKEHKRRHRWRRRGLYALSGIVVLAALGAGGLYYYANYRFNQIKKVHAKHLIKTAPVAQQQPFTLLLVGSDSRAFVDNSTQANAFGTEAAEGGQRSDVTMVARFDPAAKTVTVLSIPRDLWVDIPGEEEGISGMNRINAAFNSGPDLLVQTIEQDLGIPINHYMSVDFPGFAGMVNALGGITMDFPTQVRDTYTGLDVTTTGCQVVNGTTALELVRSRHLSYRNSEGEWEYDGQSDFSRIQRQDAFFRAVLAKLNQTGLNPFTINAFLGAAATNVTIDDTVTKSDLLHLAEDFQGLSSSHMVTETLPTTAFTTSGGADVLQEAQPYAQNMIAAFNQIGTAPTTPKTTEAPDEVDVNVLNASSVDGIAHSTASALSGRGFNVAAVGNATTALASGTSEILYGPAGTTAANTLRAALSGPVTLVPDATIAGQTVSLLIASSALTVNPAPSSGPTTTTTTTIPADVYTNTQVEPWNPFPCTLGAASPARTTTTAKKTSS